MLCQLSNIGQNNPNIVFTYEEELQKLNNRNAIVYNDPTLPRVVCEITNYPISPKVEENIRTLSIIKRNKFMDKWTAVYKLFRDSYESRKNIFNNISFARIEKDFIYSLLQMLKLSPTVISAGVSDDECIFIYAEVNSKKIHFDIFFEEKSSEVLLNITEDKKPLCIYDGMLGEAIGKLKEIFEENIYPEDSVHEIPTAFTAPI